MALCIVSIKVRIAKVIGYLNQYGITILDKSKILCRKCLHLSAISAQLVMRKHLIFCSFCHLIMPAQSGF